MTEHRSPKRFLLAAGALIALIALLAGCDAPSAPRPPAVVVVTLRAPAAQVAVGQELKVELAVHDGDGRALSGRAATWSSSDTTVAFVREGVVTGRSPGAATIRAVVEGKTGELRIEVVPTSHVPTDMLSAGATVRITVVQGLGPSQPVRWSSSNSAVASVDSTGTVLGVAPGTVIITGQVGTHQLEHALEVVRSYRLVFLGQGTTPTALNGVGQVVGYVRVDTAVTAYRWDAGRPTVLGAWTPRAINDAGVIVGAALDPGAHRAVRWDRGVLTTLLDGIASATGVNRSGEIAGYIFDCPCDSRSIRGRYWVHRGGEVQVVASGFNNPSPARINDAGWIVGGGSVEGRYATRTLLVRDGVVTWLGPTDVQHSAKDVNNAGQILVGPGFGNQTMSATVVTTGSGDWTYVAPTPPARGRMFSPGGINDAGEIVGMASFEGGLDTAALFRKGRLNPLVYLIAESGWYFHEAVDINDRGEILVQGRHAATGRSGGVLLTPAS